MPAAKKGVAQPALSAILPLSDEEVTFCWRSVVDEGRLSVETLQRFMLDIGGYKISKMQAMDVLKYMDANGDGRVGMEDFKNFMSIPCLEATDPSSFMWTPKAKYRADRGLSRGGVGGDDTFAAASAATGTHFHQREADKPSVDRRLLDVPNAYKSSNSSDQTALVPKAPLVARTAANRSQKSTPSSPLAPSTRPHVVVTLATVEEASTGSRVAKVVKARDDAKVVANVELALEKYEAATWSKLLAFEKEFTREIFDQFSGQSHNISLQDYHQMLRKWFKWAMWAAPGKLRASDSLSTLELMLRLDKERAPAATTTSEEEAKKDADAAATALAAETDAPVLRRGSKNVRRRTIRQSVYQFVDTDAKLPYRVWLDILHGDMAHAAS